MLVHIGTYWYTVCLLTRSAVIAHVQAPEFELPECWTTFEIYQLVRLVFIPIGVPCGMLTRSFLCTNADSRHEEALPCGDWENKVKVKSENTCHAMLQICSMG